MGSSATLPPTAVAARRALVVGGALALAVSSVTHGAPTGDAPQPSPDEQQVAAPVETPTETLPPASDPDEPGTGPDAGAPDENGAAPTGQDDGSHDDGSHDNGSPDDGDTADAPGPDGTGSETDEAAPPDGGAIVPATDPPPFVPTTDGIDLSTQPRHLQHVLATIRYLESRNTYDIAPNRGNASGAYQFIESTWSGFGGYQHAYQAPPAVQDERALLDVVAFLDRFDGDVSMVPLMWYYPRVLREPALMDVVPKPEHGNTLTIREYQMRWLGVYADISGQQIRPVSSGISVPARQGVPPRVPPRQSSTGEVTLRLTYPVLGPSRMASLDCATRVDTDDADLCAEQAPGVVFGVKLQPVLAAADGVVTAVHDQPGEGPISVVVTDPTGIAIEYRGFNDDNPGTDDGAAPAHLRLTPLAQVGAIVRAGQVLGFMGDSDPLPPDIRSDVPTDASQRLDPDASAPHIRLTITDRYGRAYDAIGPLLDARARETCRVGIGQWSVPPIDGVIDPITIETTDEHADIDSEWVITSTGQVWASGWAAMINPVVECDWVPADAHGPGAEGAVEWLDHWLEPYELSTELWVDMALAADPTPDSFVLPG